jgi:hypothetical protein
MGSGSGGSSAAYYAGDDTEEAYEVSSARDAAGYADVLSDEGKAYPTGGEAGYDGSGAVAVTPMRQGGASLSERIIYSAEAFIETAEFDATIEKVYDMLDRHDAFIETSYIGGRGYSDAYVGKKSFRTANFTLRVPKAAFTSVTGALSELGSVLSLSSDAVNISTQYTDAESRLNAYRTEESRLLDMLSSVNDVESLIALESRLSDVRYEIESLTSRLRDWRNQVDYSTVRLHINEVERLQEQTLVDRGYASELGDGFMSTLRGVGAFFKDLFRLAVTALPVLVIIAVVLFAVFVIVKKTRARRGPGGKRGGKDPDDGPNGDTKKIEA